MSAVTCYRCRLAFKSHHARLKHYAPDGLCLPSEKLAATGLTQDARGRFGTLRPVGSRPAYNYKSTHNASDRVPRLRPAL